jgi:hypothetical protein
MNFRNYAFASIALVMVAAGTWWSFSDTEPRERTAARTAPMAESSLGQTSAPSAITSHDSEAPAISNEPQEQVELPEYLLDFADHEDPDPNLSRTIESSIKRSMTAALHPNKFAEPRVMCRANTCWILTIGRNGWRPEVTVVQGGVNVVDEGWGIALKRVIQDLIDFPVLDPGTGEPLMPSLGTGSLEPSEPARYVAEVRLGIVRK